MSQHTSSNLNDLRREYVRKIGIIQSTSNNADNISELLWDAGNSANFASIDINKTKDIIHLAAARLGDEIVFHGKVELNRIKDEIIDLHTLLTGFVNSIDFEQYPMVIKDSAHNVLTDWAKCHAQIISTIRDITKQYK